MPGILCRICGGDAGDSAGDGVCGACGGTVTSTPARTGAHAVSAAPVENLIENGKACLRLHDYAAAVKIFSRAVNEHPTEYQGWWGLILCATASFTRETGQWATLNTWFERVKRLADAKTFAVLEKEYVGYAQKIADSDALKDIDSISGIVKGAKANVRQYRERHIKALNEKAELEGCLDAPAPPEHDDNVKSAVANHARYEKRLKLSGRLNALAVFCLVAGALLGLVNGIFLGVGFAAFAVIAAADGLTLSKMARELGGASGNAAKKVKNAMSGLKLISEKAKVYKAEEEKKIRERIDALDREMKFLNDEITATEKRILPCEKYLALGKGRIASMFFVWRCKSFGVKQEAEDVGTVVKLRKAVWDERR